MAAAVFLSSSSDSLPFALFSFSKFNLFPIIVLWYPRNLVFILVLFHCSNRSLPLYKLIIFVRLVRVASC
jgi:hypothetical protein